MSQELPAISLSQIIGKFRSYLTVKQAIDDANEVLATQGDKPDLPQYVAADADYNDVEDSRIEWEQTKADNENIISANTPGLTEKVADVVAVTTPNIYYKVTDDDSGDAGSYYWIGWRSSSAPGYIAALIVQHQQTQPAAPLTPID